jgi:hypothetical protein
VDVAFLSSYYEYLNLFSLNALCSFDMIKTREISFEMRIKNHKNDRKRNIHTELKFS